MKCQLCERELEGSVSNHHLIPVLKGGKNKGTVKLHRVCHAKIHSLFTERELAVEYNTVEKLLEHEDIILFVKWISNKPNDYWDSSIKAKI